VATACDGYESDTICYFKDLPPVQVVVTFELVLTDMSVEDVAAVATSSAHYEQAIADSIHQPLVIEADQVAVALKTKGLPDVLIARVQLSATDKAMLMEALAKTMFVDALYMELRQEGIHALAKLDAATISSCQVGMANPDCPAIFRPTVASSPTGDVGSTSDEANTGGATAPASAASLFPVRECHRVASCSESLQLWASSSANPAPTPAQSSLLPAAPSNVVLFSIATLGTVGITGAHGGSNSGSVELVADYFTAAGAAPSCSTLTQGADGNGVEEGGMKASDAQLRTKWLDFVDGRRWASDPTALQTLFGSIDSGSTTASSAAIENMTNSDILLRSSSATISTTTMSLTPTVATFMDGLGIARLWTESPAWLAFRFPYPGIPAPTKYALVSANDDPERDPAAWILRGVVHTPLVSASSKPSVGEYDPNGIEYERTHQAHTEGIWDKWAAEGLLARSDWSSAYSAAAKAATAAVASTSPDAATNIMSTGEEVLDWREGQLFSARHQQRHFVPPYASSTALTVAEVSAAAMSAQERSTDASSAAALAELAAAHAREVLQRKRFVLLRLDIWSIRQKMAADALQVHGVCAVCTRGT
jgi:hypothetical protein